MGYHYQVGIPPWYVTKPTKLIQPCILLGSLNWIPALIGCSKGKNVTSKYNCRKKFTWLNPYCTTPKRKMFLASYTGSLTPQLSYQQWRITKLWYLARIAEELDTFQRMHATEERLVNVDTIVLLQVIKRLDLYTQQNTLLTTGSTASMNSLISRLINFPNISEIAMQAWWQPHSGIFRKNRWKIPINALFAVVTMPLVNASTNIQHTHVHDPNHSIERIWLHIRL